MRFLMSICVTLLLMTNEVYTATTPPPENRNTEYSTTVTSDSLSNDPCNNYTSLDRPWRATNESGLYICDEGFTWNGWYRLFYNGMNIRMAETCVTSFSCNGYVSLSLSGGHPQIEDGVVSRQVYGSYWTYCNYYSSSPIRVKACTGGYYVYEFVNPQAWCSAYCADVSTISQTSSTTNPAVVNGLHTLSLSTNTNDPCYDYKILDNEYRNQRSSWDVKYDDTIVEWDGWYRLFINGMSAEMPEWCMDDVTCGGYSSLWLGGSHPRLKDGVVTLEVYGSSRYQQCRSYRSNPIQVKACPDSYYVYKLTRPNVAIPAPVYCAVAFTSPSIDPCDSYTSLDEPWRSTGNTNNWYYSNCDYNVNWNGWYRLFHQGETAQMPESCVNYGSCGTLNPLWLNGPHPQLEDGVVTRQVCGSSWNGCCTYRSHLIRVKACPGNYYVYEFVSPTFCSVYCAEVRRLETSTASTTETTTESTTSVHSTVTSDSLSNDPCNNYTSLDRPWRATNESGLYICDEGFTWNGWYRLFYNGMNIRMAETCVTSFSCNGYVSLSLSGGHPQIEDGVVSRQVYGSYWTYCNYYSSSPIRVKACTGGYYVYEFVNPQAWCSAYCADVSTISQTSSTTNPAVVNGLHTLSLSTNTNDPCYDYKILDNEYRNQRSSWDVKYDDTIVEWDGWYRLFINGMSAEMPEWCMDDVTCGGYSSLWLGGSHPRLKDGVVTLEVYGSSRYQQCRSYRSNPIQVKACPDSYYVYKLTRPNVAIPAPVYCAVAFTSPSIDPCDSYTSLDEPWRSTGNTNNWYYSNCDYNVNWNGWYRLFHQGETAQMPESCVNYGSCGTPNPLWLNGPHPQLEDGVVTRQVCGSSWNGCCTYRSHLIRVKACPGNYYVYEFVSPTFCSVYCAEVRRLETSTASTTETTTESTTSVHSTDPCAELSCTEDEWCGEKDGIYGCFCKENHTGTDPGAYDYTEICESSSGLLSLSRCLLFEDGFSADSLHLSDPNCKGTVQNGRVEFRFDNNDHICGTNLVANGTHLIYENVILGEVTSTQLISRKKHLKLPFTCVYSQTQTFSMNVDINPLQSILHKTLPVGQGMYMVKMIPYQDPEFSHPFTGGVNVEVDQPIFVEVYADGIDGRQFATVIDTCWGTPVNDPDYRVRWDLIVGECPNPKDDTVDLLQNGVSISSRFSFRMFTFTADSYKVFLHCSIHLCLLRDHDCSVSCDPGYHGRTRRSVDFHDSASISVGPLIWSERNKDTV